jgi:hypothetical protein
MGTYLGIQGLDTVSRGHNMAAIYQGSPAHIPNHRLQVTAATVTGYNCYRLQVANTKPPSSRAPPNTYLPQVTGYSSHSYRLQLLQITGCQH